MVRWKYIVILISSIYLCGCGPLSSSIAELENIDKDKIIHLEEQITIDIESKIKVNKNIKQKALKVNEDVMSKSDLNKYIQRATTPVNVKTDNAEPKTIGGINVSNVEPTTISSININNIEPKTIGGINVNNVDNINSKTIGGIGSNIDNDIDNVEPNTNYVDNNINNVEPNTGDVDNNTDDVEYNTDDIEYNINNVELNTDDVDKFKSKSFNILNDDSTATKIEDINQDTKVLLVGDSRFVGMKETDIFNLNSDVFFICESRMGYDWLINVAEEEIYNYVKDYPAMKVIINLGVNDLDNIDKYVERYKKYIEDDIDLYVMSINPIDVEKMYTYGYTKASRTQANLEKFNKIMKDNFKYLDTYTLLLDNGYNTNDGLHYTDNTNTDIFNYCMKELEEFYYE